MQPHQVDGFDSFGKFGEQDEYGKILSNNLKARRWQNHLLISISAVMVLPLKLVLSNVNLRQNFVIFIVVCFSEHITMAHKIHQS